MLLSDAVQPLQSHLMKGEYLQQFLRGRQDVLTPPGWPL